MTFNVMSTVANFSKNIACTMPLRESYVIWLVVTKLQDRSYAKQMVDSGNTETIDTVTLERCGLSSLSLTLNDLQI